VVLQYGGEENHRVEYQYTGSNNNYNNSGTRTLYHQGIVNTRPDTHGWKLQRNQPQLTALDNRNLQVRSQRVGGEGTVLSFQR
jgi:hypothetical protein